jgi:hypothetical protein
MKGKLFSGFSLEMARILQTTLEMNQSLENFANICQGKTRLLLDLFQRLYRDGLALGD